MIKNWLTLSIGVMWFAAAVPEIAHGRYLLATVFICYGISSLALAVI